MPPFLQNLLALPASTKALLGGLRLRRPRDPLPHAQARDRAVLRADLERASTRRRPARSPPRSTQQGIAYELRNNGTALAVEKAQTPQARIALAVAGVTASGGGSQPGYELLDKPKLGASQFQQQVTYQRALEGEIAAHCQRRRGRHRRQGAARAAAGRPVRSDEASRPPPPSCSATRPTRCSPAPCAASPSSPPRRSRA